MNPRQILDSYLHVRDGGSIDVQPVSEAFWMDLARHRAPACRWGCGRSP